MDLKVSCKCWLKNRYKRYSIALPEQSYSLLDSGLGAMRDECMDVVQYGCIVKRLDTMNEKVSYKFWVKLDTKRRGWSMSVRGQWFGTVVLKKMYYYGYLSTQNKSYLIYYYRYCMYGTLLYDYYDDCCVRMID